MPKHEVDFEARLNGGNAKGYVPGVWVPVDDFDEFYAEFFGYRVADGTVMARTFKSHPQIGLCSTPYSTCVTHSPKYVQPQR